MTVENDVFSLEMPTGTVIENSSEITGSYNNFSEEFEYSVHTYTMAPGEYRITYLFGGFAEMNDNSLISTEEIMLSGERVLVGPPSQRQPNGKPTFIEHYYRPADNGDKVHVLISLQAESETGLNTARAILQTIQWK